ncbi:MarR family winged helix-turn-helix transcriptional regulator [Spirosoma foliorum]|uniref:Winged helix-turn-helix transcriptional regulator n=1 Tax=Spirosoma foliorum TaxID=2710596 RepID=A0A7G5H1H4_9BACT|nr:MarR family winged helix-turn-helix transcriptional regulator [Spirosoma foliorum]QMW04966.1 winged helix-turn-helix transcriptional regulator [Spirosoma foliorum]
MTNESIQQIRTFNRFYTDLLGLLDSHLLRSSYSLAEGRILFEISSKGQCQASDIIAVLSIDKGYLSRILKKFEKEGLIQREASSHDGRVSLLSLSAKGRTVFEQLDNASNQQIESLVGHLPQQPLADLIGCMQQIMDGLRKS